MPIILVKHALIEKVLDNRSLLERALKLAYENDLDVLGELYYNDMLNVSESEEDLVISLLEG